MSVEVRLVDGPLPHAQPWKVDGAGAVVLFEGVVRLLEEGRPLAALEYEVYEPMTSRQLQMLAQGVVDEHALLALRCEHSFGRVPVGACSFRLAIAAGHRKPALAAMERFIDRMKLEAPIWKLPVWADGEAGHDKHGDEPQE